jgi:hypothetical protein
MLMFQSVRQGPVLNMLDSELKERDVIIDIMEDFELPRCNSPALLSYENDYGGKTRSASAILAPFGKAPALLDGLKDFINSKISKSIETGVLKSVFPSQSPDSDSESISCSQVV